MTTNTTEQKKHELPKLAYDYAALEPIIDAQTMQIHHTKHHQTYIDKLNAGLEKYPELQNKSVEELLKMHASLPSDIAAVIQNHAGGHANHTLFWQILSPHKTTCSGKLFDAIVATFGSYDAFVEQFTTTALNRFGSGWAWLIVNEHGDLEVISTLNQDSPIMIGKTPILGIDVWEHAYYLRYQNKRPEYIKNFFEIINWKAVSENYTKALP
jgi:superoxide dismutase, Fe-Mn family